MNQVARGISTTEIRYEIPTLTWLRLRWLCRRRGIDMLEAVCRSLALGLDGQLVPKGAEELLDGGRRVDDGRGRK